jgi:hypothetical protein
VISYELHWKIYFPEDAIIMLIRFFLVNQNNQILQLELAVAVIKIYPEKAGM